MVNEKEPPSVTFMMISDGVTKTYSLPKRTMKALIGVIGIIMIGMMVMLVQVGINGQLSSSDKAELDALRAKNIEQQEQINVLAQKANELQADVNRIHALEAEMRQLTNTPTSETVSRAGIVRPMYSFREVIMEGSELDTVHERMSTVEYDLKSSESNLKQMYSVLEDRYNARVTRPHGIPARGVLTSHYGARWGRTHEGIDIGGSIGTPITATAAGVVKKSGWNGGFGKCVIIDHGNNITTLYAHCSSLNVSEGTRVKRGQVIARIGNTGRSTGPHLHYEVRVNGNPVNPARYL